VSDERVLLGVDGGTHTQAVLSDLDGRVLGRGRGGASNPRMVGPETAKEAIATAVEGAFLAAFGPRARSTTDRRERVAAACFGLAGVDTAADEALVASWIREQGLASKLRVVNDTELILAAGTPEGFGIALISGTGSNCVGRAPDGRTMRVGGWGYRIGDEGSGYQIALSVLRAAVQTVDGRRQAPALLRLVLGHWSLADADALFEHVYSPKTTLPDIASLATPLMELAATGQADALAIAEESARSLALHVDAVVERLGLKRPPLALTGGVLQRSFFKKAVQSAVKAELGPIAFVAQPAEGALILAKRLLNG
jgi:N-acetylglucosamine kinase-like BadF-type ATPase